MLAKARLLLQQGRLTDAEKEIKQCLQQQPDNDEAFGLLARLYLDAERPSEALQAAYEALKIYPEEDYYQYLSAFALYKLNRNEEAKEALNQALASNPFSAGYFALYSFICLDEKNYEQALQMANTGLALDAHDISCLNARARALNRMGKTEEAMDTMQHSLAADPENEFSHTTIGWNHVEKGNPAKAIEHFRNALRLNPSSKSARDGMKEALKSRIAPYRWFLRYGLWLAHQSRAVRIAIAVGLYACFRVMASIGTHLQPPFSYLVIAGVAISLLAVIVSWLINPVANFMLLFHPQGKYALTRSEKINSLSVMAALGGALLALVLAMFFIQYGAVQKEVLMIPLAIGTLALPLAQVDYPLSGSSMASKLSAGLACTGIMAVFSLF